MSFTGRSKSGGYYVLTGCARASSSELGLAGCGRRSRGCDVVSEAHKGTFYEASVAPRGCSLVQRHNFQPAAPTAAPGQSELTVELARAHPVRI